MSEVKEVKIEKIVFSKTNPRKEFHKNSLVGEVFHWGKHKGTSVEAVILADPNYIQWCLDNIPEFCLSVGAKHSLNERLREDAGVVQAINFQQPVK